MAFYRSVVSLHSVVLCSFLWCLDVFCVFTCIARLCSCELVHLQKGPRSDVHVCPRPCFEHLSMGQGLYPSTQRDNSRRGPCSHALFGRVTNACVSPPMDSAVSFGSHMQQNVAISQAPPLQGAPYPSSWTVRHSEHKIYQTEDNLFLRVMCCRCISHMFHVPPGGLARTTNILSLIKSQKNSN